MTSAPFTAGPLDAPICFVGEAPGEDEARHGGAFIGRAGAELGRLCSGAGINKSACRLENVFQFHPKNNDLKPYIRFSKTGAIESEEYIRQREALRLRLQENKSNVIVPLGNIAQWTLTNRYSPPRITKHRGSILNSSLIPGRKIIPTIHPSAVLHDSGYKDPRFSGNWLYRHLISHDLIRIRRESEFPEIRLPSRELITSPSFSEALEFLEECRRHPSVGYDIEIRGGHLSHIGFAISPSLAISIPLSEGARDVWTPEQETEILLSTARVLEDESVVKIGQNLSFDATFMYYHYGIWIRPLHDTMIAAAVLFPDFPKGLDFLVSIYCSGEPYYKDDGKEWKLNPFASEEQFRRYNAMDAAVLPEIFPKQMAELKKVGNWESYLQQRDILHPLVFAGNKGIRVNFNGIQLSYSKCEEEIRSLQARLRSMIGPSVNPSSPAQLVKYFYSDKRVKPLVRKRKGGPSTPTVDEKALARLSSKGFEEAKLLLEIRRLEKLRSTYYGMKLDEDKRFRCSFNPVGTVQERISSSKTIRNTGGNAQNLPEDMRRLLLPDQGYLMVVQDLSQAEIWIVAFESGEERMIHALLSGVDIHSQTGCLMYGIPLEECTDEIRADGKAADLGLNYGLGPDGFALQYGMSIGKGREIHRRYHEIYPGIKEWHAAIREELARNNGFLSNCFGRRRQFLNRWSDVEKAYDYKPQSSVARKINRDGICKLYYDQSTFRKAIFLNQVHDSIWYEVPLSNPRESVEMILALKRSLESPILIRGRSFSIPVDTKVGFSISKDPGSMLSWKARRTDSATVEELVEELEGYVSSKGG